MVENGETCNMLYTEMDCYCLINYLNCSGTGDLFMPSMLTTWEAEIRRIVVPGQSGQKKVCKAPSQWKTLGVMACTCHPSDGRKRRIVVQAGLGKKQDPISKIT
jgi:hypothetical protein